MKPDVSVCIATYRRPAGLARLLESLAALKLPDEVTLEIVVVDNDPERIAGPLAGRVVDFPHPIVWLYEPRRNIAHARNRALERARGHWIAFIDDDEVAHENWLAAYWEWADAEDSDGWFGPVLPKLEAAGTPWLDVEAFFGRPRHPTAMELGSSELRTGNAFVRSVALRGERFDAALGRSGGSDTELFGRLKRCGARFRWCDEALVTEFVPASRHHPVWLVRRAFRGGLVHSRLQRRRRGAGTLLTGVPRALVGLGLFAALLPAALLAGRGTAVRVAVDMCVQAGHIWGLLGLHYDAYGAG
jgi:succinoglycan biosynthesis protein ExoM